MKILVTGTAGKLGSAVMERLKTAGLNPVGADLLYSDTTDIILDIKNKAEVNIACKGVDAVIHTAAVHGKHYDLNFPREEFIDTNIHGTLNLLNAAVQYGVKKFFYISTTSIYGNAMVDSDKAVWVNEELREQPRDIYDITKQAVEQLCKDFFYKEQLQTSVYRVGRFLPEEPNLEANHRLYRGLDERDGAEALYLALQHEFNSFEIFNIASTSAFKPTDLQQLKHDPEKVILRLYPQAADIYREKNWAFPKSIDRVYVINKAIKILGYAPKYTFDYLLRNN